MIDIYLKLGSSHTNTSKRSLMYYDPDELDHVFDQHLQRDLSKKEIEDMMLYVHDEDYDEDQYGL